MDNQVLSQLNSAASVQKSASETQLQVEEIYQNRINALKNTELDLKDATERKKQRIEALKLEINSLTTFTEHIAPINKEKMEMLDAVKCLRRGMEIQRRYVNVYRDAENEIITSNLRLMDMEGLLGRECLRLENLCEQVSGDKDLPSRKEIVKPIYNYNICAHPKTVTEKITKDVSATNKEYEEWRIEMTNHKLLVDKFPQFARKDLLEKKRKEEEEEEEEAKKKEIETKETSSEADAPWDIDNDVNEDATNPFTLAPSVTSGPIHDLTTSNSSLFRNMFNASNLAFSSTSFPSPVETQQGDTRTNELPATDIEGQTTNAETGEVVGQASQIRCLNDAPETSAPTTESEIAPTTQSFSASFWSECSRRRLVPSLRDALSFDPDFDEMERTVRARHDGSLPPLGGPLPPLVLRNPLPLPDPLLLSDPVPLSDPLPLAASRSNVNLEFRASLISNFSTNLSSSSDVHQVDPPQGDAAEDAGRFRTRSGAIYSSFHNPSSSSSSSQGGRGRGPITRLHPRPTAESSSSGSLLSSSTRSSAEFSNTMLVRTGSGSSALLAGDDLTPVETVTSNQELDRRASSESAGSGNTHETRV